MVNFGTPFAAGAFSRVSSVLSQNILLANLHRGQRSLLELQEQISSGFRINRPSDDPLGADRVLDFTRGIDRDAQFLRNAESAASRLTLSDASLSSSAELINRAREIMLDQGQGFASAQTRAAAAQEISILLNDALSQANRTLEGRPLFAGSRTGAVPFAFLGTEIVFQGDLAALRTEISGGLRASTNVSAAAFGAFSDELVGRDLTTLLPIDLNPALNAATRLSDLHGGRGVMTGSIEVTGVLGTATVDLSPARTVGDVLALINAPAVAAATGVTAALNPASNGLELSGGTVTVADVANGRTAFDLGIRGTGTPLTGTDLDPRLSKETQLQDLLGGAFTSSGGLLLTNQTPTQTLTAAIPAAEFAGGNTIEQVLNAINISSAQVDAQISEDGNRINLFSRLSGGRLRVAENGGTAAQELGLLSTLERSRLVDLNGGSGVGSAPGPDLRITKKTGAQILIDLDEMDTVRDFLDAVDNDPDLTATVSALDEIVITDTSGGAGSLVIENVSPSLAATRLGIEGSAATTITGIPVTFAGEQVEGIFTALIRLRDALLADDTGAINDSARLLNVAQEKLDLARGEIGGRVASLELMRDRLEFETTELEKLRSSTRDVDLAEAATRFHIQQTVFEAALATAARILETHLLRYL